MPAHLKQISTEINIIENNEGRETDSSVRKTVVLAENMVQVVIFKNRNLKETAHCVCYHRKMHHWAWLK